jgi:hypothetical protein
MSKILLGRSNLVKQKHNHLYVLFFFFSGLVASYCSPPHLPPSARIVHGEMITSRDEEEREDLANQGNLIHIITTFDSMHCKDHYRVYVMLPSCLHTYQLQFGF